MAATDPHDGEFWRPGVPVTDEQAYAMLDDLYAQLPPLACKGLCHDSCTAIDASELERRRMAERGVSLPEANAVQQRQAIAVHGVVPRCPALTSFNTCRVYAVRPFVCRAFGLVADRAGALLCDHGCQPEGFMDMREFFRVLQAIERLSRQVTGVARLPLVEDDAGSSRSPLRRSRVSGSRTSRTGRE